jgi:hypothetical protein
MRLSLVILLTLTTGSGEASSAQADVIARLQQLCGKADQGACLMLDMLAGGKNDAIEKLDRVTRRQIQKDADAIVEGMQRAKAFPADRRLHFAPKMSESPVQRVRL